MIILYESSSILRGGTALVVFLRKNDILYQQTCNEYGSRESICPIPTLGLTGFQVVGLCLHEIQKRKKTMSASIYPADYKRNQWEKEDDGVTILQQTCYPRLRCYKSNQVHHFISHQHVETLREKEGRGMSFAPFSGQLYLCDTIHPFRQIRAYIAHLAFSFNQANTLHINLQSGKHISVQAYFLHEFFFSARGRWAGRVLSFP